MQYKDNNPLSHLALTKLMAMEQRWAAQLGFFDFMLSYRSGWSNINANPLSWQILVNSWLDRLAPGTGAMGSTAIAASLRQAMVLEPNQRRGQAVISILPSHSPADLHSLQQADLILEKALAFWRQGSWPGPGQCRQLSRQALILLGQWDQLVEQEGVVYKHIFHQDEGKELLQLVLLESLRQEVLTEVQQGHGHQGVERTSELLWLHCYWPGMTADIICWCQECERCQLAGTPGQWHKVLWAICWLLTNEILALNFMLLEPSTSGHENVLVLTDELYLCCTN